MCVATNGSMQVTCPHCRQVSDLKPHEYRCPKCTAKVRESLEEQGNAIALAQAAHSIHRARLWLLIATVLTVLVVAVLFLAVAPQWELVPDSVKTSLYVAAANAAVLIGLWLLSFVTPLVATAAALFIFAS